MRRLLDNRRLLNLLLVGAFVWSLASVDWRGSIVHTGGGAAGQEFFLALFPPEVSPGFLRLALEASWQTVAFAATSLTLAVLIGLPLGVLASGQVGGSSGNARLLAVGVRLFLAVIRSVHELVWAVLFVTAFGFSSLSAILAIAIPYGGILGRIYAERLNDVSGRAAPGIAGMWSVSPGCALLRAPAHGLAGSLKLQLLPLRVRHPRRGDNELCGNPGLGFRNPALPPRPAVHASMDPHVVPGGPDNPGRPVEHTCAAEPDVMIRPLELVRAYRSQRREMTFARTSAYGFLLLVLVSWGYILLGTDSGLSDLVSARTWNNAGHFARQLLGLGSDISPAYLQPEQWAEKGRLAYRLLR